MDCFFTQYKKILFRDYMAKLRKAKAYRRIERPYTRKSKYRAKNFVRASPNNLIVKYEMGNTKREFPVVIELVSDATLQIRHNALEASRKTSNRFLETKLGRANYRLAFRVFPHHILRENPLASGAGADRMSTGMKMSFGKPIGIAAQVNKGKTILDVAVEPQNVERAKIALKRAASKYPCSCRLVVRENKRV